MPLLSAGDVSRMRARVIETLRTLVELLRLEAEADDSGLRMLSALSTLAFVREEFAGELLALFHAQFGAVNNSDIDDDVDVDFDQISRVPTSLLGTLWEFILLDFLC